MSDVDTPKKILLVAACALIDTDGRILLASFHPSLQNTNTGKLTEAMFLEIFKLAQRLADEAAPKRRADQRSTASGRPDRESLPPTRGRSRRAVRS